MARTGMANIIQRARALAQAGTADYTVNATAYWSDNQIQDLLDTYRVEIWDELLEAQDRRSAGGSIVYQDYYSQFQDLEEATSGTAVWLVLDSTGAQIGTADYTANYVNGHLVFTANQAGSARYLNARSYAKAIPQAAADIWLHKAGNVAGYYSFNAGGQSFSRSDWFTHCQAMADSLMAKAGVEVGRMVRDDAY